MASSQQTPPLVEPPPSPWDPLFAHLLEDGRISLCPRGFDPRWNYQRIVPFSVSGFNPLTQKIYFSQRSRLAERLQAQAQDGLSDREDPHLNYELLFSQHDYLHSWSVLAINELMPELGYGLVPITRENYEDFVFCHMLTETMAVVGLDYWYLSIQPRRRFFVVAYYEQDLDIYRQSIPDLLIQDPAYFDRLLEAYCLGTFRGFSSEKAHNNALLKQWLAHELGYAIKQRRYTRLWLAFLASETIPLTDATEKGPIRMDKPWMRDLAASVKTMLWEKVKDNRQSHFTQPFDAKASWKAPLEKIRDFRFINYQCEQNHPVTSGEFTQMEARSIPNLFYQTVSAFDFDTFDHSQKQQVKDLLKKSEMTWDRYQALTDLLHSGEKLPATEGEPRDLFVQN